MSHYLLLLISLTVASIASVITYFISRKKTWKSGLKVYGIILIVFFFVRYFSYPDQARNIVGLIDGPFSAGVNFFALIGIWIELTLIVLLVLYPFFKLNIIKHLIKFVLTPLFLLYLGFSHFSVSMQLIGYNEEVLGWTFPHIMFLVTTALIMYGLFLVWKKDYSFKLKKEELIRLLIAIVPVFLASMPMYSLQIIFGSQLARYKVVDLSSTHRIFIYISIIVPFLIYFGLYKKDEESKRFAMTYLSLVTMITFAANFYYLDFLTPWSWPIHLCNTAMFLLPLIIIFRMDKLFYFTYFINVFGALMAMLMPNYNATTSYTSFTVIQFWYNHAIAYFVPLLLVGLKLFERPKMKQMFYSLLAFSGYFILVIILNSWFSNYATGVDFFFTNSDFIADKLGKWARNIFAINVSFNIGDLNFEFHPLYQVLFLLVYVGVAFAMWFVYSLGYSISDSLVALRFEQKRIKLSEFALQAALNGRSKEEPMEADSGVKLELRNFSKKYGRSEHFAVKDASLTVYGGEIFGFLGPNGAGKSTTIKAIVGIHTITEGSIFVCGFDVEKQPVMAKQQIGYVPDHYALYEKLTAREYINYIADIYSVTNEERQKRIPYYTKLFNLEEAFDNQIKTFSHGMKQKVAIIAALIHEPKLWLLDEPLTGLDPDSIYQVKEVMKHHASKGNIVMFSSHLIDVVENLCQRIVVIKKGHLFEPIPLKEVHEKTTLEQYYLNKVYEEKKDE
ncbi:MAG: ATP-binding cassette domain-containing protein [Bacilli bacterium]|jgi:ABC-2 type transport system ATP-binding protein|nr:YwaF family protein [Bacilli bacterium]NLN80736.1 ATP-binding cassette domain-containing protein [Erysipelotrichia bacterium]